MQQFFCRHVDNRLISCISPPPPDKATDGINHHRRRLNQRCGTASDTVNPSIFHLDVYCSLAARRCRKCGARARQASLLPDRTEQNRAMPNRAGAARPLNNAPNAHADADAALRTTSSTSASDSELVKSRAKSVSRDSD